MSFDAPPKTGRKKAKKEPDFVIKMKDEEGKVMDFEGESGGFFKEPAEESKKIEAENTIDMI